MAELDILLSWSGTLSMKVAEAFYEWLPKVIPGTKPWMSTEDIRKGKKWFAELMTQLEKTHFCLICVTPENVRSPWIYYEIGAIAAKQKGDVRVCAYILGVDGAELANTPISQFQWTIFERKETWKLIRDINATLNQQHVESVLEGHFKQKWKSFKKRVDKLIEEHLGAEEETATDHEEQESELSPEATELLLQAAKTDNEQRGIIMKIAPNHVSAAGKDFGDPEDERSMAVWEDAVRELATHQLIEDKAGGGVFTLRSEAYRLADQIANSSDSFPE